MIRQLQTLVSGPTVPAVSVWIVLLTLVFMPIYPFMTTWLGAEFGAPLVWKAAKDILLVATAITLGLWLLIGAHQWPKMKRDWLLWALVTLVVMTAIKSIVHHEILTDQVLAGLAMNGRYLAILFVAYTALRYGGVRLNGLRKALPVLASVGVGLALLGILQVFVLPLETLERFGYDKETTIAPYILIDDNPDAPRAFATLRGPNDYGAFLLLTTIAAAVLSMRQRWWALGVFVMVFALVLSSSRSAWLGLVTGFMVLAGVVYIRSSARIRKAILAGVVILGLVGATVLVAATTVPALRLAVFHSSPDDTHLTEGSTDDHWQASMAGVNRVAEQPLGCGIGCSGPASFYSDSPRIAENYFIQIAEEIGIVGLAAWLSVFGIVMYRLWLARRDELALVLFAAGVGLSVVGFWLHVWADDPIALIWWGLAGLVLGSLATSGVRQKRVD